LLTAGAILSGTVIRALTLSVNAFTKLLYHYILKNQEKKRNIVAKFVVFISHKCYNELKRGRRI